MGHYGRFGEYGAGGLWWTNWWVLLGFGVATLALIFIVWGLMKRRGDTEESAGVDPEIYENMDGQIRSMLVQAGGDLSQDSIGDNLGVPVADLAKTLHSMEERGEILRVWIPSDYTYGVQLAEAEQPRATRMNGPSTQPSL